MIVTVFFNEKDAKKKDIALDFQCESYAVENGWVSIRLTDRIIHLPEYRIKEVQSTRESTK